MLSELKCKIPLEWYPYIYPAYKEIVRRLDQLDRAIDKRTMSEARFLDLLVDLGFTRGATVMVHSALSRIRRRVPDMSPERLIRILQDLVGPEGTLLMLTFSFSGRQAVYVETHTHFDVQNTPSQLGVITEVFRKTCGVVRSLHPTHSVSAWGRHANDLVSTHHLGPTYGVTSPFCKLREFNGLVIGLGTRYRYGFGPTHVIEELDPKSRKLAFEDKPRKMIVRDGSHEFAYEFCVFRPGVNREYERIANIMLREKILRYVVACGLPCLSGNADAFIRRGLELAAENNYIIRARA